MTTEKYKADRRARIRNKRIKHKVDGRNIASNYRNAVRKRLDELGKK